MSETRTSTGEIRVHFPRSGTVSRDYHLADGATLADLVRLEAVSTAHQYVFVDGVPPEEAVPLRDGAVVTVVARPREGSLAEPWHASVPSFRDEDLAREYSKAMKARRESDPGESPAL